MKKILVPVDFSDLSSHALNFAIEFNEKVKGEILLVHVVDLPVGQVSFTGEVDNSAAETFYTGEFLKATHNKLAEWFQKSRRCWSASVHTPEIWQCFHQY